MANYYATPILPLAVGKVRYVGEAIAAVIARSRYTAEDAVELIDIAYEPLGPVSDPERNVAPDAPLLHEEAGTNVLIAREFKKGDTAAGLAGARVRVRDRFTMARKAPLAMEPRSYSAEYERRYDPLTLYTSSNVPGIVRDALSIRSTWRAAVFASSRLTLAAVSAPRDRSIPRKSCFASQRKSCVAR